MTRFSLILRTIRHFRWANLAVLVGVVVATATLTGALMVGDSVRESLRQIALQRLGPVDHALIAGRFFSQSLAERVARSKEVADRFKTFHNAIVVHGGAATEGEAARTAGVQIAAIDGDWAAVKANRAVINEELANSLPGTKAGDPLLLNLPTVQDGPLDAALARRGRNDVVSSARTMLDRVVAEPGLLSMFNLAGGQRLPRNAWLNFLDLQDAVGQEEKANVILVEGKGGTDAKDADALNKALKETIQLQDYGLMVTKSGNAEAASLGSSDTYLLRPIEDAADRAAKAIGVTPVRVSSYLVNTAAVVGAEAKSIHYAMTVGISEIDGKPLAADEIAINQWAADRLGAKVGDQIRLDYYQRQSNGDMRETTGPITFKVARILPMRGVGADPSLTPAYKGFTDADSVSDWHAPEGITIRKDWVTKDDEAYWKDHKAAPKLFISMEAAHKLWSTPFGDVTSIRVPADKGDAFAAALREQIDPASMGLVFRPIKAEQLAATSGSTDFAGLFIGFSFFLIAAALLLVAMLFRLNVEQRARQIGLMAALGFGPKSLRRMAMAEGLLIAVVGAAIGLVAAVGYTWLMMAGLRTWWIGAVGTRAMHLHVVPETLIYGFVGSVVAALLAIWWGVWRVGRTPASRLLAGAWGVETADNRKRSGRWALGIGWIALVSGLGMLGAGMAKKLSPEEGFLGGGLMLLIAGLCFLAVRLRPQRATADAASDSVTRLGVRNASRHRARSVLTAGLIAFATFTLVTIAAMRGAAPQDTGLKSSGAGGYRLMLNADIPLTGDLNTPEGRRILGVVNNDDPIWSKVRFTPMRRWRGEDISCLNLMKPGSPTILSVPPAMVERNAFTFADGIKKVANRWDLLSDDSIKDAIPVIADHETAQYILHLGLGESIPVTDQSGTSRKLVLVATLEGSIFQGQLLMGEGNFQRLFPSQSGAGVVLMEVAPGDEAPVAKMLNTELGDFSVTVDRTADVLAMYKNVQNTYLATFQVLGSLGLLLGTVGLAVVLLRGLIERRSELAMLAAIGFRRADRLRLVLAENVVLLLLGLAVGAACAMIAVLPTLLHSSRHVHVVQTLLTLGGVMLAGMASLVVAVWFGGRHVSPADLRSE